MKPNVFAIEITAYDPVEADERTLYFATGDGFCTAPTDTPANMHFSPRVIEAGNFGRFVIDPNLTDGRARASAGEVVLANADGGLDALAAYGLDGRRLVIRRGRPGTAYPGAWTTVLTGTMEQAEFTWRELRVLIRDRQAEVASKTYQETKYAGTNSLPNGVEGVEGDLKGRPKPRLHGKVRNIAPPLVNTSKLTFQVSDREIDSLDAVYVGGLAISAGTTHGSLAALQAATVSAGTYDIYLGSGSDGAYFRMGTAPDHTVTCNATAGAAATDRTAAQIAQQVLLDAGVSGGDINAGAVSALDTLNDAVVGHWAGTEETTVGAVLEAVLASIGAFWAVNGTGEFTFGRLDEPAGLSVQTFRTVDILDRNPPVERLRARGAERGLPCWRVKLGYRKNWLVQEGADVVPAVSLARRNELREPYLIATAEDASVRTTFLLAPEKELYTLLDDTTDAADEADRLQDLYGVKRDLLRFSVSAAALADYVPELGDMVALDVARFDWAGGKLFAVTGIIYEFSQNTLTMEIFG